MLCFELPTNIIRSHTSKKSDNNLPIVLHTKLSTSHAAFCWNVYYLTCQEDILTAFCCTSVSFGHINIPGNNHLFVQDTDYVLALT